MWWSRRAEQQPDVPVEPAIVRADYRTARLELLRGLVALERDQGLELGAFDFPTVEAGVGRCEIADTRSAAELSRLFGIALESIAPVTYVLERGRPLAEQIPRRFDYVVLCHVLEHIPDPVGFLNEIAQLLRVGGIAFLAIPDKRRTLDATRPSTTIDHLLASHYQRARAPALAQLMEFARTWSDTWKTLAAESPREFYAWAVREFEAGHGDVHCNVWQDVELFAQLDYLIGGGFLPGLEVCARGENRGAYNEFYVALRKVGDAGAG